jgi:hypothetical protein
MSRSRYYLTVMFVMLSSGPALAADWWNNFWTDWHRNNCWMEPFNYPDRACVGNTFEAEIAKGWQLQSLLGEPHFDADNGQISPAGMAKLRTIMAHNPVQFRNVYVERGANDEITAKRLMAAQRAVAGLVHAPGTEVLVSEIPLIGSPADQVNGVNTWLTGLQKSYPAPQTKAFHDADSSSGGGSSGSP